MKGLSFCSTCKVIVVCSKFISAGKRLEAIRSKTKTLPFKIDNKQHEVYLWKLQLTVQVLWGWCAIGWVEAVHIMGFYHNIENTSIENLSHFYYEMNLSTVGDLKLFDIKHSWKDNTKVGQPVPVLLRCAKTSVRHLSKIMVSMKSMWVSVFRDYGQNCKNSQW